MLLRRHRATPEIDPAFNLKPADTLDPAFKAGSGEPGPGPAELKGKSLAEALESAGLDTSGTADEKRARYAEWLAAQEPTE